MKGQSMQGESINLAPATTATIAANSRGALTGGVASGASIWLNLRERFARDARLFQIVFLGCLLTVGVLWRDFTVSASQVALTFAAALCTQAVFIRALGLAQGVTKVGYLSAIVTAFGLSILVRADSLWIHPLIAGIAIAAKFTLRISGKHVYNPANLGVILAIAVLPGAWASPGQWGNDYVLVGWVVALGIVVSARAQRFDTSLAFLITYTTLVALRVLYLGQPVAVLGHQLASGALLLFSFFMISDPMTTPNHPRARILFAVSVAIGAFVWQFILWKPNALVWSLFLLAPLVPLADRFMPAQRHQWQRHR